MDGWNSYGNNNNRGVQLAIEIRALRNQTFLDFKDRKKLEELEKELTTIQDSCWHTFETVTLFLHIRRYCSKCDKEDKQSSPDGYRKP